MLRVLGKFSLSLLLISGLSSASLTEDGAEPVTISGTSIQGLIDISEPGPYNKIYKAVEESYDGEIELTLRPMRRAVRVFSEKESDCLFVGSTLPEYYDFLGVPKDQLIHSNGINEITMHVVSGVNTPVFSSRAQMTGYRFAVDTSAGSSEFFKQDIAPKGAEYFFAQTLEQAFDMLRQGRVQGVIGFDIDVSEFIKRSNRLTAYHYDPDFALIKTVDAFACWKSDKTDGFITHVNEVLARLDDSGELQLILGK